MTPWLVLDTATPTAVVGVVRGGLVLAEHTLSETRKHAEGLIDAIDRVLLASGIGLDQIGGVAVGRGPGSFIGIRTGIATAKGLCLARGIPLVGLPSLEAIAHSASRAAVLPPGRGLAVIDAKRGEVYAQLIEHSAAVRAVEPAQAMAPAEAWRRAEGLAFLVGHRPDGAAVDTAAMVPWPSPSVAGLASALVARAAGADPSALVDESDTLAPDYCRPPDAKLPALDPGARRGLAGMPGGDA